MTRAVLLLAPVLTLTLLPSNVVATALPLLRVEWNASSAALGWVFAAYQAGYVASVLLLLPLTDRVPAGQVIVGCAIASTASSLLFPWLAHDVWSAAALRALIGAGLAGVYLPGVRVVAESAPRERRGHLVGAYVSAFYFGTALSLWASGALLTVTDWRGASLILGLISAIGIPLAIWSARGAVATEGRTARLRLGVLRSDPIWRTVAAYSGHAWELYVSRGWLPTFFAAVLASRGVGANQSAAEGGQWAALATGCGTVGVWLGGWVSDRLGRARTALTIAAASGCLSLVWGFLGGLDWAVLVGLGCVYAVLVASDSSVYSTAITEWSPRGELGSAQAAQAGIGFAASTVAPIAAGAVLDLGGGFGGAFILAGLASLLGAAVLVPLARRSTRVVSA